MKKKIYKPNIYRILTFSIIIIGLFILFISTIYLSSYLTIFGLSISMWGIILLYITPKKHISLSILNAISLSLNTNIERILSEMNFLEKGIYLPPKYAGSFNSIICISKEITEKLPNIEDVTEKKLFSKNGTYLFLTPPGLQLSQLIEKEFGFSFIQSTLEQVQQKLPKIIVENMELAQTLDLIIQNNIVIMNINGNVLDKICSETKNLTRTHNQIGCIFSSAVACILAKATGRAISIKKYEQNEDFKNIRIEYKLGEE